jgi:thioredoxin-like negative regulator of GroEL
MRSVRSPSDFQTLLLIHTSRSAPLITLWTASWCRSCAEISPLIKGLVEDEYTGLDQGGVGFVEVQLDSPTIADLGMTYSIKSVPTLLSFSRGEPQWDQRVTHLSSLEDARFLRNWIEKEAARGSKGGAGGSWLTGLFGT